MEKEDRLPVLTAATAIITTALVYLFMRHQTFVHIDAIAHVNKARGIWDNQAPGIKQLGSIWLPLQALLMAPLTLSDTLWSTGLAGSLLSAACFVGTAGFLFAITARWTGSRPAGWLAFLLFALNPRLIYLFTTPMTEPLMVLCATGLVYFLVAWVQSESWTSFALACLMVFCGTLARYEGWSIAAAAVGLVFIVAPTRRIASSILFAGAAAFGPMLWMIYNMIYFDDPIMFAYGRGSARDYAEEYFRQTGKLFPTAGKLMDSVTTYWTDVAYCLNPGVLWLALAGVVLACLFVRRRGWRPTLILTTLSVGPFLFYCYNLYANMIPVLMPGMIENEPESIYNVRYGTVMAATAPVLAAFALFVIFELMERRRVLALSMAALLFLPDPIPEASEEPVNQQITGNLFYTEGIHNQSFWMPPFVEIAKELKIQMDSDHDGISLVLTNSRIVHPTVWTTAIHMNRFIDEMAGDRWGANLKVIEPGVKWVITEEGDQLWHAQARVLQRDFVDVAASRTPSTGVVHLYRRKTS